MNILRRLGVSPWSRYRLRTTNGDARNCRQLPSPAQAPSNERFAFRGRVLEERHGYGVRACLHGHIEIETLRKRLPAGLVPPIELEAAVDD